MKEKEYVNKACLEKLGGIQSLKTLRGKQSIIPLLLTYSQLHLNLPLKYLLGTFKGLENNLDQIP